MNKFKLTLPLVAILLSGCILDKQEVGEIPVPPKQSGNLNPLPSSLNPIDKINIRYQAGFEVREAEALFAPKGVIKGISSPMVPLSSNGSDLDNLGFTTYVSLDGRSATLTYSDYIIQFTEGDKSMFVNNRPGVLIDDAPLFNNSTLYVPIVPVLQELDIHYEVEGNTLVIGEQYTDEAVQGRAAQQMETSTVETESPTAEDLTTEE